MDNLKMTGIIDAAIEKNNFSGVVSIREERKIIYEKAVGYAERSNKRNNKLDTKFGIASGTKLFTALAVGKLVEQGKISFKTKVFDLIKYEFPLYSKEVTIEHLLTHTSGIPDYFDEEKITDFDNFTVDVPWYEMKEPSDYFPIFPQEKMKFSPGERFSYSNSGFVLLAAIVEEVSGMKYKDFVEQEVLKSIGMNNSGLFALNKLPANTAVGYVEESGGWRTNVYNLPIIGGGDGGAFTTIGDLYKLWDAFLNYKIISKDMVELYTKSHVKAESEGENDYYGYGIWIYKGKNEPVEEYIVGSDPGVSFKSALIREKNIIYTVISNTSDGAWPIIREIISLV